MSQIDDNQLLQNCQQLQAELNQLKQLKLSSAVQVFRYECEQQAQKKIENKMMEIEKQYKIKEQQLETMFETIMNKSKKNKQQIQKQKDAFQSILEQIEDTVLEIQQQYKQNMDKVNQIKQNSTSQWKRMSNEQIKKTNLISVINKHMQSRTSRRTENSKTQLKKQQSVTQNNANLQQTPINQP